ncbi:transcription factor 25-like isoform X3 [Trichoplusia ni]|uniref:Transcription factor 25-like isoform X3 n=1 Tax=Trichoplusia ni TaxID=7111 RepID=A0A7E5VHL2_TRINI|nr:transcription factor 25-like isoform X3 [Trichoplusia ni]
MSSRTLRKKVAPPQSPVLLYDSDDDFSAAFAQPKAKPCHEPFFLSSPSDSEPGYSERSESEDQECTGAVAKKCVVKKKNLKKKVKALKSGEEANAQAGAAKPPKRDNWAYRILRVDAKNLNVAYELRRLFGPEEDPRRRRPQPNRLLLLRRIVVHPSKETMLYDYKMPGLSMAKFRDVKNRMYFIFNHSEDYKHMHRNFIAMFPLSQPSTLLLYLDEARKRMHVEALLEISDLLFRMEEHAVGNEILENVVTFMQYVAHPLFNLAATNVRLEYRYLENRPFHVAMLKYMYLLSSKGCHRTALEIAKMLLLLDPSDPLAVLNVIDAMALRAREHEWLIEAIKYFDKQREAGLLYNIKYSLALAHFHVALKNKKDLGDADKFLKDAILAHPHVMVKIFEVLNIPNPYIYCHPVFAKDPVHIGTPGLNELFNIYGQLTACCWREREVLDWITRNAKDIAESYNRSSRLRAEVKSYSKVRHGLFMAWPPEYLRHISVLNGLSRLVLDGPLTAFFRPTCAWDPLFDKSVNRYDYKYRVEPPRAVGGTGLPVYSYDIRKEFMIVLSNMSDNPSCLPFLSLHPADAASLMMNEAFYGLETNPDDDDDDEDYNTYDYDDDAVAFEHYDREIERLTQLSRNLRFDADSDDD